MRFVDTPARVAAAAAAVLRLAVGIQGLATNPLLTDRQLDSEYYVAWARDIAAGDVFGAHGLVAGRPFILNPLYAYVLAPIVSIGGDPGLPVVVFQALLGGGTAA